MAESDGGRVPSPGQGCARGTRSAWVGGQPSQARSPDIQQAGSVFVIVFVCDVITLYDVMFV